MRQLRLLISAALASAVSLTAGTPPAAAAESPMPTRQAKAYGMDWVPYIDPADLPPLAERKAICLIDTGVAVTPDLPADNPEGPIVARLSVDGGSGLPGPAEEHKHGTSMASMASALAGNDWGTVGAWPGARIVSVRAMDYGRKTFATGEYVRALSSCVQHVAEQRIVVANVSLGSPAELSTNERALVQEYVARLHDAGSSVVVAAGNFASAPTGIATAAGGLAVAAGDTSTGALCPYASFSIGMLTGPGCGIDMEVDGTPAVTDGGGSSTAAAVMSALIAVLRTLKPEATWQVAERWVHEGATQSGGRVVLSGEGAARVAGLSAVVERAKARMLGSAAATPSYEHVTTPVPGIDAHTLAEGPLAPPRGRARYFKGSLRVSLAKVDERAERVFVRATFRRPRKAARRIFVLRERHTYVWPMNQRPQGLELRLLPYPGDIFRASAKVPVRVR